MEKLTTICCYTENEFNVMLINNLTEITYRYRIDLKKLCLK